MELNGWPSVDLKEERRDSFLFLLRPARNVSDPGKLRSSGYWRHKSRAEEDYQADIEGGGVGVLLKKGRCSGVVFSSIQIKRNLSKFFFSLNFIKKIFKSRDFFYEIEAQVPPVGLVYLKFI
jgi:hypothetical protein